MWRHITGVKRPAETNNQQKDEDESKKSKRRRFNTKWTIGDNGKVREWLIYDRSTDEMYCSDCRMYGSEKAKSNPFVIGTKNLKLEAIKDHESSKSHLHTISCKISKTALPEETAAVKALTSMKAAQFEKMRLLFRNVHAIGKKMRPFSDYVWMCE
ncbi:MAG: hypothetical protein ACRC4N_10185 [Gammaproteobacteria bacterium]